MIAPYLTDINTHSAIVLKAALILPTLTFCLKQHLYLMGTLFIRTKIIFIFTGQQDLWGTMFFYQHLQYTGVP